MKRALFRTQALRPVVETLHHPPRRRFMTVGTKNPIPPKPVERSNEQSMPLGPYYESILNNPQPIPKEKPEEPPASSTDDEPPPSKTPSPRGRKPKDDKAASASAHSATQSQSAPTPTSAPASGSSLAEQRARVIFGSRLAGPAERAERLAAAKARSTLVAGVLVPPQPDEPDNCCMSGCVNCVWDRYRDEMEDWALASAEADRRLRAQDAGLAASVAEPSAAGASTAQSMDDDGGGSQANWDVTLDGNAAGGNRLAKDFWDEELYRNVPVGIREFMRHEKRLKERHIREGTLGG